MAGFVVDDMVNREGIHILCECGRAKRLVVRVENEPAQAQATATTTHKTAIDLCKVIIDEIKKHGHCVVVSNSDLHKELLDVVK